MTNDIKRMVAESYDRIADAYFERFGQSSVRTAKLAELIAELPARATVLDLGCGIGEPVVRSYVAHGFRVTGVDASLGQIERARRNVPEATFIYTDMTSVQFPAETFDAVSAFYSITHVPKNEHAALVQRIATCATPKRPVCCEFRIVGGGLARGLARNIHVLQSSRPGRDEAVHQCCWPTPGASGISRAGQ
jgi:ubiquinone/menaquinone biosynthesis C-methylase UbiE